jgi:hypothetical protein
MAIQKEEISLMQAQISIIGDATEGLVQGLPSIEHWIKTVSNTLYKLSSSNASLRCVGLLTPVRIKAIVCDIKQSHSSEQSHSGPYTRTGVYRGDNCR